MIIKKPISPVQKWEELLGVEKILTLALSEQNPESVLDQLKDILPSTERNQSGFQGIQLLQLIVLIYSLIGDGMEVSKDAELRLWNVVLKRVKEI